MALVALMASLFAVPTLGHPFWTEAEEGGEFTPPCLTENWTYYGYHRWYNGTESGEEFTPPCVEEGRYPLHQPPWLEQGEGGGLPDSAPYQYQRGGCGGPDGGGYGHRRGGWGGQGRSMGSYGRRTE